MHSAHGTRLLSIGEIFDRAVHVTIANLLPLVAIVGIVAVPVRAIADWISRDALTRYFGAEGRIVADPRLFTNFLDLIRDPDPHSFNWPSQIWLVASLFPMSLAIAAASIASLTFLNGERPALGAAYRFAIRRLAPVVGASMLSWGVFVVGIVVVVIVLVAFIFVWLLTVKPEGGAIAGVTLIVFTAAMILSIFAVIASITPLANCTFAGAALYTIRPFTALREAWTMTMSRGLRGRTFALGAGLFAVTLAQGFIALALCGFLSNVTHSPWLSFVANDAITLLTLIFSAALAVVFYLDARNRVGFIQDPLAEQENSRSQ